MEQRITVNMAAMLRALSKRPWRRVDCVAGQVRTLNTLERRGLATCDKVEGFWTFAITDAGRQAIA